MERTPNIRFGNIEERNTVTQQRRAREREREEEEEEITQCEEVFYKLAEDILRTLKRKTADKYSEITEKVEAKIKRLATRARRNPRLIRTIARRYADLLGKEYVRLFEEEERKIWKKIKRRSATEVRRKEEEKSEEYDVMFA